MATRTEDTILVAKESFDYNGGQVHKGQLVRVGHELLNGREGLFAPLVVHFDLDEPKAAGRHAAGNRAKTAADK